MTLTSFTMPCPVCGVEITDVEGDFVDGHGWEEFWGRPVRTDDSEFELLSVPSCPECGRVTVSDEQATEFFWDQVYGMEVG